MLIIRVTDHYLLWSQLEGSNQVVSDQGVRKTLYQKVSEWSSLGIYDGRNILCSSRLLLHFLRAGYHRGRFREKVSPLCLFFAIMLAEHPHSERHEEEVWEGDSREWVKGHFPLTYHFFHQPVVILSILFLTLVPSFPLNGSSALHRTASRFLYLLLFVHYVVYNSCFYDTCSWMWTCRGDLGTRQWPRNIRSFDAFWIHDMMAP